MERALGAGAVGGQSAVVADLTGWRKQRNSAETGLETGVRDLPGTHQLQLGHLAHF